MREPDLDEYDEATLDDAYDDLTDEELDDLGLLYAPCEPDDPLAGYATPVTRQRKPDATDRTVRDVLRTL